MLGRLSRRTSCQTVIAADVVEAHRVGWIAGPHQRPACSRMSAVDEMRRYPASPGASGLTTPGRAGSMAASAGDVQTTDRTGRVTHINA